MNFLAIIANPYVVVAELVFVICVVVFLASHN